MFCNNCGKKIIDGGKFCNFCGNKIVLLSNRELTKTDQDPAIEFENVEVWVCDYCKKEFEIETECDDHEKICKKNPNNFTNLCSSCGTENKKEAVFCKNCGNKLNASTKKSIIQKVTLNEGDKRYQKIKNAGVSGEALGWFNLIVSPIIAFSDIGETESDFLIFNLIYFLIVSFIFIKYGKNLKKVTGASLKDTTVLIWTSVVVILVNILSALGEEGGFSGILFFVELYYLFQARKVLKSLANINS